MPGIDTAAPERTDTSSGLSPVTEAAAGRALEPLQRLLDLRLEARAELLRLEVLQADGGGDGEAGRNWNAERGHLGEPGALAAEDVLHGGGAVRPSLAEEIDQGRREGAGHTSVAASGAAWRSCTSSSVMGVGYCPEKQAWQNPVPRPAASSMPSRDR